MKRLIKINCFAMTFSNQWTWTSGSPSSPAIQTVRRDMWRFRCQSNQKLGLARNKGNGYEGGRCHEAAEANQHVCALQSRPYSLNAYRGEVSQLLSEALLLPGWRADTWHVVDHRGANTQKRNWGSLLHLRNLQTLKTYKQTVTSRQFPDKKSEPCDSTSGHLYHSGRRRGYGTSVRASFSFISGVTVLTLHRYTAQHCHSISSQSVPWGFRNPHEKISEAIYPSCHCGGLSAHLPPGPWLQLHHETGLIIREHPPHPLGLWLTGVQTSWTQCSIK